MKSSKIGTGFIVFVLALAGIGISYAGLSEDLTVYGTVDTATVILEIEDYSGTLVWKIWEPFNGDMPQYWLDNGLTYKPNEEVAIYNGDYIEKAKKEIEENLTLICNFELVAWAKGRDWDPTKDPLTSKDEPYDAVIEFKNIFPCINFHADICFHYEGSIPAKVDYTVDWTGETTELPGGGQGDWLDYLTTYPTPTDPYFKWHLGNSPAVAEQVHYCNTFGFEVDLRIPQNDLFEGLSGTGYLTIDLRQWTDDCSPDIENEKLINLPTYPVKIKFDYPNSPDSYWKETILSDCDETVTTGDLLPGGPYNAPLNEELPIECLGWCVDRAHTINNHAVHCAMLYSAYDDANNPRPDADWPKVAWLINNKDLFTANWEQFQYAIWEFINGGYQGSDQTVLDIIAEMNNHPNFIPQEGDLIPVVVYVPGHQITFIEVDP